MIDSYLLAELAELAGAKLIGDGQAVISGVASITSAKPGQISFLGDSKYRSQLSQCQASALILRPSELPDWPNSALVVADPYLAYARIASRFDDTPQPERKVSLTAIVAPDVELGKEVAIGDFAVIGSGVRIADGVVIGPHCFVGENVKIGSHSRLCSGVNIYHGVSLGEQCLLHSGAVIGSDGFGFSSYKGEWVKIPQLGGVRIGSRVEIGANTTVDRGALDDTIIEDGVIIDNQCHIAHNVTIGAHTAIAGGVILSGGLKIGRYCRIGGASVINGHMKICDRAVITGMTMVMRPITQPGVYSSGIPAQSNKEWRKMAALVLHIDQMNKRIKALERATKKDKS